MPSHRRRGFYWLLLLVGLVGCGPANAPVTETPSGDPPKRQTLATPASKMIAVDPQSGQPGRSFEVLPASENAGSVKLLPSAEGLDMFWTRVLRGQSQARFNLMHVGLARDGSFRSPPRALIAHPGRHIAVGDPGTFGLVYQDSTGNGWAGNVSVVRAGKVVWDAPLPNQNRGQGTMAIGWDPRARRWVVVGEELSQMPTGHTYYRLFVARYDERGTVVAPTRYLSEPPESASLSNWGNPMIWAGDRLAVVWQLSRAPGEQRVILTELAGSAVKHIPITTAKQLTRGVLAHTKAGYVIAGGESCTGTSLCSRVFMTTLRDGAAAPIRYLSDERKHASEAMIATDGTRVAIAWHESDMTSGTNQGSAVFAAIVDADGAVTKVARSNPPPGQHDWVQSMTWDGSQFVLAHTNGINPSSIQLVFLP